MNAIPNETDFNYHDSYNMIAGVSMSLIGFVGVFSNILVVSTYIKSSSERTSFNTLGVARAIANLYIMILLYGVVFIPTTFLGYTPLLSVPLTALSITVAMALYATNENQTFLTALNRFCALYFPFHYSKFCGMKPTVFFLVFIWIYHLRDSLIPFFTVDHSTVDCWPYFSPLYLTWTVTPSDSCPPFDEQMLFAIQVFALTTLLNIATFSKVVYFYRNKSRTDAVSRRKEKKNILLFFQTVLQDFLYVIDFAFTFYLSQLIKHRLWTFLSGSLIWQMIHAIDGLIMIVFNEKISFWKRCFKKPSSEQPSNIHYDAKRNSISAALATIN